MGVDILGELRHFAKGGSGDVSATCSDAAAEIERLREEVAALKGERIKIHNNKIESGGENRLILGSPPGPIVWVTDEQTIDKLEG